jgi:hypothetical protein
VGSESAKLKASIEKKTKVPTNVTNLFKNPEFIPTILFVAAAIKVILVIIRKVAPPLVVTNSFNQGKSPPSKISALGIILPPFIAKFTELNKPPITKKNKNIFTVDLFKGLRVSEGLTARSVILIP